MNRNLAIAALLTVLKATAQTPPEIEWQRNLGGSMDDSGASITQTTDGGYILCGTTYSSDGQVTGYQGNGDIWVVKLDTDGAIEWQRCLGGSQPDIGRTVLELPDGYLVMGSTRSTDGDVSGNHGLADIWIARLNLAGTPIWQRCYGGSLADVPFEIQLTPDGGWIIAGESRSSDGDVTANAGFTDYWVLKMSAAFDIEWQRSYGGSGGETGYAIELASDGGYILNGYSDSMDGDVEGAHGSGDYWVVKLNGVGDIQWQRPCGGSGTEYGFSVIELDDGSIVAFGEAGSEDGDRTDAIGASDYWTIKLSATGEFIGSKSYGGTASDRGGFMRETSGGGSLMCGSTESSDGDLTGNQGSFDGWLVRVDESGDILWQLAMGGSQSDGFGKFFRTVDGGYVVIGGSSSTDGDLPGNQGGRDIWVVKLGADPVGYFEATMSFGPFVYPNPCGDLLQILAPDLNGTTPRWWVVDQRGRIVATGQIKNGRASVPAAHWAMGPYTLVLEGRSGRNALPFVKN